jgi:hypothetical protein
VTVITISEYENIKAGTRSVILDEEYFIIYYDASELYEEDWLSLRRTFHAPPYRTGASRITRTAVGDLPWGGRRGLAAVLDTN